MAAASSTSVPKQSQVEFDNKTKFEFAQHFAPLVRLSPNERYRFMDPEIYADEMCTVNKDADPPHLVWKEEYAHMVPPFGKNKDQTCILPPKNLASEPHFASKNARLITYFDDNELIDSDGLIRIVYSIFYPFNGPQTLYVKTENEDDSFYFEIGPMGRHFADWEHVTVFIKLVNHHKYDSHTLDELKDIKNYELYCVYASQHNAYNIGLSEKYFNKYKKNGKFKKEFQKSPGYTQSQSVDVKNTDKKHKGTHHEQVYKVETEGDNGHTPLIFSSFNGHANHFQEGHFSTETIHLMDDVAPHMKLGKLDLNKTAVGVKAVHGVDVTSYTIHKHHHKYFAYELVHVDVQTKASDQNTDEKADEHTEHAVHTEELDEVLYPSTLNKVLLLVKNKEDNGQWYSINDKNVENNDYKGQLCKWANLGSDPTLRWGPFLVNNPHDVSLPHKMKHVSKHKNPNIQYMYHLFPSMKGIVNFIHGIDKKIDLGKLDDTMKQDGAQFAAAKDWWLRRKVLKKEFRKDAKESKEESAEPPNTTGSGTGTGGDDKKYKEKGEPAPCMPPIDD